MRGTVAHGAAFSKHFAAFTLAPESGGAPGRSAADDDENARQLESSRGVDVVLNAKDGWEKELLGDICDALHLSGSPYASNPSPEPPAPRHLPDVVVELLDFFEERLEPETDGGDSPGVCYHPTRLRTRPLAGTDDGDGAWTLWTATPRVDETPETSTTSSSSSSPSSRNNTEDGASGDGSGRARGVKKVKKDTRAIHFAALLVREFGRDNLRKGGGVVDVAGGAGDLAFQLSVRWGIRCTVVDPRGVGVTLTSRHKRLLASRAANRAMITETWLGVSPLARQLAREWETFAPARADHVKALFDESLMSDASVAELIRTCSAVVGLHPDQATGAIVDCGLVMNKPWAVVPCCVFPSRYPHRLDQSGKTARTTGQLVEHLMGRAAGTRRCTLPCEGASDAVWWKPPDGYMKRDVESEGGLVGREDWRWPSAPPGVADKTRGPFQLKALADSLNE